MTESKIDLTDRLKREGRWEEASLFEDEKIKELRTTGLKRPEAQDKAWEAMEQAYPPLEPEEEFAEEEIGRMEIPELKNEKINKSALTIRLKEEGRWAEARGVENQRIKELREEGREQAWMEVARRYPPAKTGLQKKR